MNSFMLTGKVLSGLEVKATSRGIKMVCFVLEVENENKNKGFIETETFKITCFGSVADYATDNLKFGSMVGVNGVLCANNYSKDGKTYYTPQPLAKKLTVMSV